MQLQGRVRVSGSLCPAVLRRGSRSEIHLVLDCVYVFIFQQKLKRRKKDNTSGPRGI